MKLRNALSFTLLLSVSLIGNAQADRGYYDRGHRDHDGYRGYYSAPQHHHNHDRNWGVPAAVLAITGLAIGAAAYQSYQQPRPAYVYSAPPQPVAPPPDSGNWYYCNSAGNYYPYVRACPEGWQAVAPPR